MALLNLRGRFAYSRVADVAAQDLIDGGRAVDDLVGGDAGHGGAEDDARGVAAGLGGAQADCLEPAPDLGDVLDADPVQLDVLPVGDVGGVAAEVGARSPAITRACSLVQGAAVAADAHHEELVVELLERQRRGLAAGDPGLALRVEPPPAHAAAQVVGGDRAEALLGVDVLDAGTHVEAVVLGLERLVLVERLGLAQRPLALGAGLARGLGGSWLVSRSSGLRLLSRDARYSGVSTRRHGRGLRRPERRTSMDGRGSGTTTHAATHDRAGGHGHHRGGDCCGMHP